MLEAARIIKCGSTGHKIAGIFVCRGCMVLHETEKKGMEEFYSIILHWHVPGKHAGMIILKEEMILNKSPRPIEFCCKPSATSSA